MLQLRCRLRGVRAHQLSVPEGYCDAGRCEAKKAGGFACASGEECLSNDCQIDCTEAESPWCGLFVP